MAQSDDVSFPRLESPNRGLGGTANFQSAKAAQATRKKRSSKKSGSSCSPPPRLTSLISLNKSRKDMELFLTMRGIRVQAQKSVIDEAITEYNAAHKWAPWKDPTKKERKVEIKPTRRGRKLPPPPNGPETSVGAGPHMSPLPKTGSSNSASPEHRVRFTTTQPVSKRLNEQTDMALDRKLQRLENDRMLILQEMNQRQAAVETLQRAQRVRLAKHTVKAKRLTAQEEQAAVQLQSIFRGHRGREKAMAKQYRSEHKAQDRKRKEQAAKAKRKQAAADNPSGMSAATAAKKIQAAARGRQGRRKAKKIVRPFGFELGGHQFKHSGRRRVSVAGVPMYRGVHIPDWGSTSEIEQKAAATNKVKSNSDDFARKMAYLNAPDNPEMDMFRFMDKDHDGFVSAEDLVAYFEEENSGSISAQTVASLEALVVEADSDGDGKLNPEEFMLYCVNSRKVEEEKIRKGIKEVPVVSAKVRRQQLINKLHVKRDERQGPGRRVV